MLTVFLLVLALVCFILAGCGVGGKFNLQGFGLASLTLALILHLWPSLPR